MLDQADDLRRLAMDRSRPKSVQAVSRPTLLAVAGGKGGVGTTTVAIGIAAGMTRAGNRTIVIDADPRGGDVALRCGLEERYSLADLLNYRQTWADVVEASPSGVRLVAGARWADDFNARSSSAADRLLELLADCSPEADTVVVDIGNMPGRAGQQICQAADAIVMITTTETSSVLGTFATIKTLASIAKNFGGHGAADTTLPLHLLVNMAPTVQDAEQVQYRLSRACRRLLGIELIGGVSCLWELSAQMAIYSVLQHGKIDERGKTAIEAVRLLQPVFMK
jgi:flagellar biosynthesis protein FlhG